MANSSPSPSTIAGADHTLSFKWYAGSSQEPFQCSTKKLFQCSTKKLFQCSTKKLFQCSTKKLFHQGTLTPRSTKDYHELVKILLVE
ncbi:hypothetical protein QYE76_066219 [Lolium multiflorum]|uniref:Uncharacterized protein n=1 Tax=Lolium multiflorum TaxID=4521 RepID=A0AAD8SAX0_LOLMU|nr:hypothetical protein QYE76_066219 [Lolium multiflorum]